MKKDFKQVLSMLIFCILLTVFTGCDPDAPAPPSTEDAKSILTFVFEAETNDSLTEDAAGTIEDYSIRVIVADGIDLRSLKPAILYDAAAIHPGNLVARDFSSPADYIVMAEDGTTSLYTVTVAHESEVASLKSITSFVFKAVNNPSISSDIAASNISDSAISVTVPYGTDTGSLVPTIVHTGKSIVPVSEAARNFNGPQSYTVTAGDDTTAAYTVTVTVSNPPGSVDLIETGASTVYTAGDDASFSAGVAWPSPRFTDNSDGTITDNATGLMWEQEPSDTAMNWETALAYCNNRDLSIYSDWRMPNIRELESIINYEEADQAAWLESQGFLNVTSSYFFSSTTQPSNTIVALAVSTDGYGIYYVGKTNSYYVIAVRSSSTVIPATGQTTDYSTAGRDDGDLQLGVSWPSPRFEADGNVIVDNLTGLMWERAPSSNYVLWATALSNADSSTLDSYYDWRLPNTRELLSLINFSMDNNAAWLVSLGFSGILGDIYWSSTTAAVNTSTALGLNFDVEANNGWSKTGNSNLVLLVRGGD